MGIYSEDIVKEIQRKSDIVEIISDYVSLKKRGDEYVGLCPFHSEKTPSFSVNPSKQLFYCFGCGVGGNVYTFLMKKENLSFPEAVRRLADRYGISFLPEIDGKVSKAFKIKRQLLHINSQVANFYTSNLFNTKEGNRALNYLKKRGINYNTIKTFSIGYALPCWDSLIRFAKKQNIDLKLLNTLGLVVVRKDKKGFFDRFRDRVMFPIMDNTRNIIGFGGRVIGEGMPKYLNSPESPVFSKGDNLYGINLIKRDPNADVIVVEGYMDCISLYQRGITQCVASLGTALTQKQAVLLKRFTNNVILAYDADSAGKAATLRGMDILENEGLNVKVLNLPTGKDPDDFIKEEGVDAFKKLIANSLEFIEYKLKLLTKGLDLKSSSGKLEFLQKAIKVLANIDDKIKQDLYIKKISTKLGVSEFAIKSEIKKRQFPNNGYRYKKSQIRNNNKESGKILSKRGIYKAEACLLKMFMTDEYKRKKIKANISPDNFSDKNMKKIAEILYETYNNTQDITISDIYNYLDEDSSKVFSKIMIKDIDSVSNDTLESLIMKVKENYYQRMIEDVRQKIKHAEIVGRREEIKVLLKTYMKLKYEMEHLRIL